MPQRRASYRSVVGGTPPSIQQTNPLNIQQPNRQVINSEILKILAEINPSENGSYVYTDGTLKWTIDLTLMEILNVELKEHAHAAILIVFASNLYDADPRWNPKQKTKTPEEVKKNMNYIIVNFVKGLKGCYSNSESSLKEPISDPVKTEPMQQVWNNT